jgi:hypothetical protein
MNRPDAIARFVKELRVGTVNVPEVPVCRKCRFTGSS